MEYQAIRMRKAIEPAAAEMADLVLNPRIANHAARENANEINRLGDCRDHNPDWALRIGHQRDDEPTFIAPAGQTN